MLGVKFSLCYIGIKAVLIIKDRFSDFLVIPLKSKQRNKVLFNHKLSNRLAEVPGIQEQALYKLYLWLGTFV